MPLYVIGNEACSQAFNLVDSSTDRILKIAHTIKILGDSAFMNMASGDKSTLLCYFDRIDFGDEQHPIEFNWNQAGAQIFKCNSLKTYNKYNFNTLNFYVDADETSIEQDIINFLRNKAFDPNHMDTNGDVISTAGTWHYKNRAIHKI